MGSSRDAIIKTKKPTQWQYNLTAYEHGFIKDLNTALVSSIYHRRLMAGFLGYIASTQMGVPEVPKGSAYKYELDINEKEPILTVTIEKDKAK